VILLSPAYLLYLYFIVLTTHCIYFLSCVIIVFNVYEPFFPYAFYYTLYHRFIKQRCFIHLCTIQNMFSIVYYFVRTALLSTHDYVVAVTTMSRVIITAYLIQSLPQGSKLSLFPCDRTANAPSQRASFAPTCFLCHRPKVCGFRNVKKYIVIFCSPVVPA